MDLIEKLVKSDLVTANQVRMAAGLAPSSEICEWCKGDVRVMCQKGTGVCSQKCAQMASKILFSSQEKAEKFGGGYAPDIETKES